MNTSSWTCQRTYWFALPEVLFGVSVDFFLEWSLSKRIRDRSLSFLNCVVVSAGQNSGTFTHRGKYFSNPRIVFPPLKDSFPTIQYTDPICKSHSSGSLESIVSSAYKAWMRSRSRSPVLKIPPTWNDVRVWIDTSIRS